ncbi:alpha/beta hydrolase [Ramlibacter alkalitolerans]|uniref:Alpha/beta hydrolase n=1 Tax=Ramlibacter alkalitolerans TaxID=2039631 RepID=A0ABS1JJ28_9BURK|nr:alpha/beta hydrolase [Ramlibacter alkalitolerans]MBL0424232.1 alpha/beta hydrolase [Ramlibacter alkalitolerans]
MNRRALLRAALAFAPLAARAGQDNAIAAAMNDLAVRPERDVPYGPDRRQRFDAYLPGTPSGPLLLLVHGGAWRGGDKRSAGVLAKARYWTARGYVVVSTNYRLLPEAHPLAQARDVARALAQVQRRASGWGADAARCVLMGHSSGAHLAALLSAEPALTREQGADPWRGTVCLDNPAFDVPALMNAAHDKLYDRAFGTNHAYWRTVSPLHILARDARRVLAVCSTRSPAACAQAQAFAARAGRHGVKVQVEPVDKGHMDIERELGLPGAYSESVERWISSIL